MSRQAYGPHGQHTRPRWTLARDIAASIRAHQAAGTPRQPGDYTSDLALRCAIDIWLAWADAPERARQLTQRLLEDL